MGDYVDSAGEGRNFTPSQLERKPAEVFHLVEFIEEELQERGWTLRDLVFRMRRYESERDWATNMLAWEMFMTVREKDILLGQEMANDLGVAFDVNPQTFLNIHEVWRKGTAPISARTQEPTA